MSSMSRAVELRKIAAKTMEKNAVYLNTLAFKVAEAREGEKGGVQQSFFDGFSVGMATGIGMLLDGTLNIQEIKARCAI